MNSLPVRSGSNDNKGELTNMWSFEISKTATSMRQDRLPFAR